MDTELHYTQVISADIMLIETTQGIHSVNNSCHANSTSFQIHLVSIFKPMKHLKIVLQLEFNIGV